MPRMMPAEQSGEPSWSWEGWKLIVKDRIRWCLSISLLIFSTTITLTLANSDAKKGSSSGSSSPTLTSDHSSKRRSGKGPLDHRDLHNKKGSWNDICISNTWGLTQQAAYSIGTTAAWLKIGGKKPLKKTRHKVGPRKSGGFLNLPSCDVLRRLCASSFVLLQSSSQALPM